MITTLKKIGDVLTDLNKGWWILLALGLGYSVIGVILFLMFLFQSTPLLIATSFIFGAVPAMGIGMGIILWFKGELE